MTTRDPNAIDIELARALRERAADVGDEEEFYRQIVRAAVATPARHRFGILRRRTVLVLAAALLGVSVVAAGIGGRLQTEQRKGPSPALRNGAILVADDAGGTVWIAPDSGAPTSASGLPSLPGGTDAAAWSRDGRHLAVVVNGDLVIIDPIEGTERVVAECAELGWECTSNVQRGPSFAWSPDGTTIAFSSQGLSLVDVGDGQITEVIDDAGDRISSPSWSPDGLWIAVQNDTPYSGRRWECGERSNLSGPTVRSGIA